jgi:hypothetical protein
LIVCAVPPAPPPPPVRERSEKPPLQIEEGVAFPVAAVRAVHNLPIAKSPKPTGEIPAEVEVECRVPVVVVFHAADAYLLIIKFAVSVSASISTGVTHPLKVNVAV